MSEFEMPATIAALKDAQEMRRQRADAIAAQLTAVGDVLAAAVAVVASAGPNMLTLDSSGASLRGELVPDAAFRALADAVERAQPGAVEARKAGGR